MLSQTLAKQGDHDPVYGKDNNLLHQIWKSDGTTALVIMDNIKAQITSTVRELLESNTTSMYACFH